MKKIHFYCGKVNSQGGSKISLLNVLYLLKIENIEFEVYVNKKGWFTKRLTEREINFTIINEPRLIEKINKNTNVLLKFIYLSASLPQLFKSWKRVNRIITKKDKVVLNESRDLILFFPILLRKNVEIIQWIRSEYAGRIARYLMKKANKIIAVSDIVKSNITKQTEKPIYRIHNFMIDKPINVREKTIERRVNIAIVGSIQEIKGQLDAVKVLKQLRSEKEVLLHIIGREFDQNYVKSIKKYIDYHQLTKNVKFIGHVDNVPKYLNENIYLTLIPSQTESFCRVAMESISVGVPVIAYKVGGLTEVIIDNKTGILVSKDNIKDMSASVELLIFEKDIYTNMKKEAIKDWESRFYFKGIKEQMLEVLT